VGAVLEDCSGNEKRKTSDDPGHQDEMEMSPHRRSQSCTQLPGRVEIVHLTKRGSEGCGRSAL
jgi:hypothetical protein